jgi:hypothetical protein
MNGRYLLAGTHMGVAVAAFGVAAAMGLMQALSISDIQFPGRSESVYYISVTAHGVLMALVFTTFFIMGLGYVLAQEELGRIIGGGAAWFAFWLAAAGSVAAAATILSGKSTVLYTFYPSVAGTPVVLHRGDVSRGWILDLGSGDDRKLSFMAPQKLDCADSTFDSWHARDHHHLVFGDRWIGDRSSHHANPVVTALGKNH